MRPGESGWLGLAGWKPLGKAVAIEIGVRVSSNCPPADEILMWPGDGIGPPSGAVAGESGISIDRSKKIIQYISLDKALKTNPRLLK